MNRIIDRIDAITEDRRSSYVFDTKKAAAAVNLHEKKFGQEWYRRRRWLLTLAIAQPGETAAEFAAIIAQAVAERERMESQPKVLRGINH